MTKIWLLELQSSAVPVRVEMTKPIRDNFGSKTNNLRCRIFAFCDKLSIHLLIVFCGNLKTNDVWYRFESGTFNFLISFCGLTISYSASYRVLNRDEGILSYTIFFGFFRSFIKITATLGCYWPITLRLYLGSTGVVRK